MYICMYACMHVYMHACVYVCMYVCRWMHACRQACMMYVCKSHFVGKFQKFCICITGGSVQLLLGSKDSSGLRVCKVMNRPE